MTTSALLVPAGKRSLENASVTVTGWANCVPSGPNRYGVPTAVVSAGGAALVDVTVIGIVEVSAPDGTLTPAPSPAETWPPAGPMSWLAEVTSPHAATTSTR